MLKYISIPIKKLTRDTKIYHKMIAAIILMIIIPLLFLSYISMFKYKKIIENEISISYQQVINEYAEKINFKIDTYENLMDSVAKNSLIQDIFSNQNHYTEFDVYSLSKRVNEVIESLLFKRAKDDIMTIVLYAMSKDFPSDGFNISNVDLIKDEPWYKEVIAQEDVLYHFYYEDHWQGGKAISIIRPIYNLSGHLLRDRLGFIKIDITADDFFSYTDIKQKEKLNDYYILDSSGCLIFNGGQYPVNEGDGKSNNEVVQLFDKEDVNKTRLDHVLLFNEGRETVMKKNQKEIMVYKGLVGNGWKGVFFFPYREIENKVLDVGKLIFLTVVVLLVIFISLTILFSKFFTNRIMLLVRKMSAVEGGNLDIKDNIDGQDEIGMLDQHFNRMVKKLKQSINETYIVQIEKREAELTALQTQINPHFLYNTLEVINSIASVHGLSDIYIICQKLGDMFRYSINIGRNEFVTLEDEIKHIRNYITIMQIRFENKFEIIYDIPCELLRYKVLKFILQPIVENALLHGFVGIRGKGCLEISAYTKHNTLSIRIQDDGVGMNEDKLKSLNEYINEVDSNVLKRGIGSIGIKNVNSRIKLTYGETYGVTVQSEENAGTQVEITLPVNG